MIVKSLLEDAKFGVSVPPALRDNASVNGSSLDLAGFQRALVVVHVGDNDVASTFELEDSADNSSFADVDVPSAGVSIVTTSTDEANECWLIDVDASKIRRYLRVQHTAGDGLAGTPASAFIIAYGPRETPVAQPASVTDTITI